MAAPNTEGEYSDDIFTSTAAKFGYDDLKTFQKSVIRSVLFSKTDAFVSCKTGSGKSMCFQGITTVCESAGLYGHGQAIVLVISPLISLMETQVKRLRELGISATYIGRDVHENKKILGGEFRYLHTNPEHVIGNKQWRDMLKTDIYRKHLACIVFDEVHTAVSW